MSPGEQHLRSEVEGLQDLALVIEDPLAAERMLSALGVLERLWEMHLVDSKDRCLRCRAPGRRVLWRRRQPCDVRAVYNRYRLHVLANGGIL
jgi:hypothetical protein